MKTVVITRFPYHSQLGGEELHTLEVAKHFQKKGHKVELLTSCPVMLELARDNKFEHEEAWLYKPPVTFWTLLLFTLLSPLLFLKASMMVSKIRIKKSPVVYMLSFGEKLLMTPFCFAANIPVIWIEHARISGWFNKNPWKHWYKFWANRVEIVTVSKMMRRDLGVKSVKVIDNAIDTYEFDVVQDAGILPKKLKEFMRSDGPIVGYVGRLTKDKGMDLLIAAAKELPDVTFVTIGAGPYYSRLKKNGVHNYPYLERTEIAAFMQSIDAFVLPATEKDPFGLVVLEAFAAKTPVVVSKECGISESLEDAKDAVIVTESDFVKKLGLLLKNSKKRDDLVEHAHATLTRKFSLSRMLEDYEKLL